MSTAIEEPPVSFALRIPESWYEFDIWEASRTGDVGAIVDTQIADQPDLLPHREKLINTLSQTTDFAAQRGAVYSATMLEEVEDGVLAASLIVFHTEGPADPEDRTVDAIAGQIPAVAPCMETRAWRRVEIVEISAGLAVRIQGVESHAPTPGLTLESAVMHTIIPVPDGSGGGVLDVMLTSPQVDLADQLFELFDAVSGTLAWPHEDLEQIANK